METALKKGECEYASRSGDPIDYNPGHQFLKQKSAGGGTLEPHGLLKVAIRARDLRISLLGDYESGAWTPLVEGSSQAEPPRQKPRPTPDR